MSVHTAVVSTWPCTICPSSRPLTGMLRSRLTSDPSRRSPRFERRRVSLMAVTVYVPSPGMATTVRHTPLWASDWSMRSSSARSHWRVRCTLPSSATADTTRAVPSTIPENILLRGLNSYLRHENTHFFPFAQTILPGARKKAACRRPRRPRHAAKCSDSSITPGRGVWRLCGACSR